MLPRLRSEAGGPTDDFMMRGGDARLKGCAKPRTGKPALALDPRAATP
jgi:hypothetical protein